MSRADEPLFEHAPPLAVQQWFGPVKADRRSVARRAVLVVLVGWLPLVVLAAAQSLWTHTNEIMTSLVWEPGVHARYLIAAPLLVLAEAICAPQLKTVAWCFVNNSILGDRGRVSLEQEIASTRRLLASPAVDVAVMAIAYLVAIGAALSHAPDQLPDWVKPVGGMPRYSLAGWWHLLVSLPLLLMLIIGWFWRLALWTRLLWRISRLDLHLIAPHPDRCGGLGFLGHSVRAFAIVGMALAVIVAGRSAHVVLEGGGVPTQYFLLNLGLLATIMALFIAPLLVFTPVMLNAWQTGTLDYGTLANRVGRAFEHKWLGDTKIAPDALEKPDFSATTDLYAVVANVHAMRFLPVDLKALISLAIAMVIPFVPVVLMAFPLKDIWEYVKSLLF